MKELGNLAIICAKRMDLLLEINRGAVAVHIGSNPKQEIIRADWKDDKTIANIIRELNFGKYKEKLCVSPQI